MRKQEDDNDRAAAGGGAVILFWLLFFVGAFVSAAITVACVIAWKEEKRFFGRTLTPNTAHLIVAFGWVGIMVAMPLFRTLFFQGNYNEFLKQWWIPVLGYSVGTNGCALYWYAVAKYKEKEEREALQASMPPPLNESPRNSAQQTRVYEFASWDDEDRR